MNLFNQDEKKLDENRERVREIATSRETDLPGSLPFRGNNPVLSDRSICISHFLWVLFERQIAAVQSDGEIA